MWNIRPIIRSVPNSVSRPCRASATRRGATADHALDAVFGHEVQATRAGADDWLPALHGSPQRPGNQRDLRQLVAPIWHTRRQGVVLARMRERALAEGLENDLNLLFKELAIRVAVEHR